MTLVLEGSATFMRLPKLAAVLEAVPPGQSNCTSISRG